MRSPIVCCAVAAATFAVSAHFVVQLLAAGTCEDPGRLKLPHVTVTSALSVAPGALVLKNDELPRADSSFFTAFEKLSAFWRVCPYPLQSSWTGSGSRDEASSYVCK